MTAIFALLFLLGLFVITMGHAHAQKMLVKLVGLLTEAAVLNASILPVEDNRYAVKKEKSVAYMEVSRDASIPSVHYLDKRIRLAALGAGVHTMFMRPKSPLGLVEIAITNKVDKAALGTWILKKIAVSKVKHKGIAERRRYQHLPAQVPEYRGDRSFRVSVRDLPLTNRPYPGDKNQLYEKVGRANSKALTAFDNRLVAVVRKDHKKQMVNYQRPKSLPVLEAVWKKYRQPITHKSSKIALQIS